jgi:hypothetical protein
MGAFRRDWRQNGCASLYRANTFCRQRINVFLRRNYLFGSRHSVLFWQFHTALGGDRLDLHDVAKFSEALNQTLFLLVG